MYSANHYIRFPISDPLSPLHDLGTLFNRRFIGYLASLIPISCLFPIFLRPTEVFVELSSLPFVLSNMVIDPVMTDLNTVKLFELVRDLFRAPIFFQSIINDLPFSFAYSWHGLVSSLQCFVVGLFWAISTLALITASFPAYGRFMNFDVFYFFGLITTSFQKCRNLVSLYLGKLFVSYCEACLRLYTPLKRSSSNGSDMVKGFYYSAVLPSIYQLRFSYV
jgi:hypothetical protein